MLRTPVSTIFGRSSTPNELAKRDRTGRQMLSISVNSGRMPSLRRSLVRSAIPAASEAAGSPGGTGLPSTITRPDTPRLPDAPKTARASSPRPEPARPVTPSTSPGASAKLIALSRPGTVRFSTVISGPLPSLAADLPRRVVSTWRPTMAFTTSGRVMPATGPSATTWPSRITVRSSQTSKISLR